MKLDNLEDLLNETGIIFLTYGGFLTQPLIASMTDALEKEAAQNDIGIKVAGSIFTIFIEMAQNMMNYGKQHPQWNKTRQNGLIVVGVVGDSGDYFVASRNLVSNADRDTIDQRMTQIEGLDKSQLRELYRERRKSGRDKHAQGAGIGFIEIARRSKTLEHAFYPQDDGHCFFTLRATVSHELGLRRP